MSDGAVPVIVAVTVVVVVLAVLAAAVLAVLGANIWGAVSYRWNCATPIGRGAGLAVIAAGVCTVSIRAVANDSVWEVLLTLPGILMSGASAIGIVSWIERRVSFRKSS